MLLALGEEHTRTRRVDVQPSAPRCAQLEIQVDGQASYALLHRVLKASGVSDVGITRFNLAVEGGSVMPVQSSSEPSGVPNSVNVSVFVGKGPSASVGSEDRRVGYAVGRRQDTFWKTQISGHVGFDSQSLEPKLRELHSDDFDYPVVIDAAPEALCSEVVAVCDLARKAGFQQLRLAVATEDN